MEEIQPGIFREGESIFTEAASPKSVYGENFVKKDGKKFRQWEPSRSKAGAAVMKGVELELERNYESLYLGAASGTTVSHFSDVLTKGFIYAIEYSDTVIRDLLEVAEARENIAPVLANARNPEEYEDIISGEVDLVFQDISQKDQAEILIKNAEGYLKPNGIALIAIKAHSISSSRNPEEVFQEVKDKLSEKFSFLEETRLDPYEKDHLFLKMCLD